MSRPSGFPVPNISPQFRGVSERTLADQAAAVEAGFTSVTDYAIDLLAKRLIELEARVEALEGPRDAGALES